MVSIVSTSAACLAGAWRVKAELKRKSVTYTQLVERLADVRITDKEINVAHKQVKRGVFFAMFNRDWNHGLAFGLVLGGCLVLILLLLFAGGYPDAQPSYTVGNSSANTQGEEQDRSDIVVRSLWHWDGRLVTSSDTAAQWIMMVFTVIAAGLLLGTLIITQRMARETTRIGDAQARAYLSAETSLVPITYSDNGAMAGAHFRFQFKNVGASLATECRYSAHYIVVDDLSPTFAPEPNPVLRESAVDIGPGVLAPHAAGFSQTKPIHTNYFIECARGNQRLFVTGRADYKIFGKYWRFVEICCEVEVRASESEIANNFAGSLPGIHFRRHGPNNDAD